MLPKYIVCATILAPESVLLLSKEVYYANFWTYEPITGSDEFAEAQRLEAEVKRLGVSAYLDLASKKYELIPPAFAVGTPT